MKRTILSILLLGLLLSCSRTDRIEVTKTNFDEEVSRTQNLVFTFNRPLVTDTLMLHKWDTVTYLKIQPAIQGKYMWTAPDELTFSPSALLPPSTDFTVMLMPALAKVAQKTLMADQEKIHFHTPYLQILSINSYWAVSDNSTEQVEIRILISFNNPVNPEAARRLIRLKFAGKEIPFRMLSQNDSESIEIALPGGMQQEEPGRKGDIIIAKGLNTAGGNHPTTDDLREVFAVPEKDQLVLTSFEPSFDAGKGVVRIYTNQPLVSQKLNEYISVEPSVPLETQMLANGVSIKGDFLANGTYSITVRKGLKSLLGPELQEDIIETVAFGAPEPYMAFTTQTAMYMPATGSRNLGVHIISIPEVKLSVFKIFENNIQHYMRLGKEWNYDFEDDEYYDYSSYSFDENYGKPVISKVIQTRSLPMAGNISLLNLDLAEMKINDPFKGIYIVRVESTEKRRLQDAVMVSLSDIGLIAKEGADELMVFANSLKDGKPISGVTLDFYSTNNQKIYSATTDKSGIALFKEMSKAAPGFKVGMISAKLANDFNFLVFNSSQVELSRFDLGGKATTSSGYDTYLYTDRDLFRPGDTCNFNAIVRTTKWEVVKNIPLKIKVIAPNGKEFRNFRKMLSATGCCDGSIALPPQSMTGSYYIEVYTSNNVLLASKRLSLEEFIPDRIKVSAKPDNTSYLPAQKIAMDIQADNLFGTPAAGRKYEVDMRMSRKSFQPNTFPQYHFYVEKPGQPEFANILTSGITDQNGHATQYLNIPDKSDLGIIEAKIYTTVFDENNRPVNRVNKVEIITQKVFLGIKKTESWISTRRPLNLSFIAVDRLGKAVPNTQAEVQLTNSRYETVVERSGNTYRYITQLKETTELSKLITCSSSGASISFTPRKSGLYKVKIRIPGSDSYVSYEFNAYGFSDTDYASFEVDREGQVEITADKSSYKSGDIARLLIKAPFDGNLLLAFEQDKVLDYKYIELVNNSASVDVRKQKDFLPNIFVTATLVKRSGNSEIPLTVAHGTVSLKVEEPDFKIPVTIAVPEKSRANRKMNIAITTSPGAEVTVAVVDEGILQVTGYQSPDPYNWFFSKRALAVKSYDLYGQLYPEISRLRSSMAGGEGFDLTRRMNPFVNKRVKLLSKWSGILKADRTGKCQFTFDVPQFSGALRVMAVAYQGNKFGSSEKVVKVADPVVVIASLPRFLSPNDRALMNVNVTNTTASGCSARISIKTEGPVAIEGTDRYSGELKAGAEQDFHFTILAKNGVGPAKITAIVEALGQNFEEVIDIPVRPASGLRFISGGGIVKAGTTKTIQINSGFIPVGVNSSLMISKSPASEYLGNLNELFRYPYGCCEQVISAAFPQIYLPDLVNSASSMAFRGAEPGAENPGVNVQQAIYQVESRQLYNGGFSMWPEGGMANWWITAYAAHFLLESEKAGFEVNRRVLDGALKYLEQKVKDKEYGTYQYISANGTVESRRYPCREIFYSIFSLALSGKAPIPFMNFYKSQFQTLTPESRYLLAAAYMIAGDRKSYQVVLPDGFGNEKPGTMDGGSLSSFIRDLSVSMLALLESDPGNPQVGTLAMRIGKEMKASKWLSTQERAMAMLALGKLYKTTAKSDLKAVISIDGKTADNFDNQTVVLHNNLDNKQLAIKATGSGDLYYFWELSGIPINPPVGQADHDLKVRKYFYDRNGNPLTDFNQNDLVNVVIKVEPASGKVISNVAITDVLPACFEIENQRLQGVTLSSPDRSESVAAFTDIRDDRISFFTDLAGPKTFSYTVRVVSKGNFRMGPVTADAMYDGSVNSYSGGGTINVR